MKKIFSVKEIREAERLTMELESISSIDLMERAGSRFVEHLYKHENLDSVSEFVICCGPGNNGGDGLVIARLIAQSGKQVKVVLCYEQENFTHEFSANLQRLKELYLENLVILTYSEDQQPDILSGALIIDAIFGIGLSKPLDGFFRRVVDWINELALPVIAVDVPSGLFPDRHIPENGNSICADVTITFQFSKLAYFLPENEKRVGRVAVIDIGLVEPEGIEAKYYEIDRAFCQTFLATPSRFTHKGVNGHGLLIAGSAAMPGAALLAARSAMRGGIGKVTLHAPASVLGMLSVILPEALCSQDIHPQYFSRLDIEQLSGINAIAVGPGIGTNRITAAALSNLIDEVASPMIFDADALNLLAENKTWLAYLPQHSILTPHFKEFERLAGKADHDFDRLERLSRFAQRYTVIVILKGAYSVVAMPDGKLFFNTTGNPGMATAGSGDVLTGLLLALLSKGYTPPIAAMLAVYLHGLAGDLAVESWQSYESLIASDLIEHFGEAFNWLRASR